MSDKADKKRPKIERIARMEGSTSFRDPREGFGISTKAPLSDQDVAAAIALSRRRLDGGTKADPSDIGPECLETYYGSTQTHRRLLVFAYVRDHRKAGESFHQMIRRRMAATLAVQMLAGITFTRSQWAEFGYLYCCRREDMEEAAKVALAWFKDRASASAPAFGRALRETCEVKLAEQEMHWEDERNAADRVARIRSKLYTREGDA